MEKESLPYWEKVFYGLGGAGSVGVVNAGVGAFIMAYYTDTAYIAAASLTTLFMFARLFDGVTDIIMGMIIDRTHTRLGKARPWILLSAPLLLAGVLLLFHVPETVSDTGKIVYAYVTYIFMNCIVFTMNNLAHNALLARLSQNPKDRVAAGAVSYFGVTVVAFCISMGLPDFVEKWGWTKASILLGMLAFVTVILEGIFVKEKESCVQGIRLNKENAPSGEAFKALARNKYFFISIFLAAFIGAHNSVLMSVAVYYCNVVLRDSSYIGLILGIAQLPCIFFSMLVPFIAKKMSKRNMMIMGCIIMICASVICAFAGENKTAALAGNILRNLGTVPIFGTLSALNADIVDYGEIRFGIRSEGLVSIANSFGSKIGMGLGSALVAGLLAFGGYNGALEVQGQRAVNAVRFGFGWLAVMIAVLTLISVLLLDVERQVGRLQKIPGISFRSHEKTC